MNMPDKDRVNAQKACAGLIPDMAGTQKTGIGCPVPMMFFFCPDPAKVDAWCDGVEASLQKTESDPTATFYWPGLVIMQSLWMRSHVAYMRTVYGSCPDPM